VPYFKKNNLFIASMASPPTLGMNNYIERSEEDSLTCDCKYCQKTCDKIECSNEFSQSQFVFDETCNPHPRFRYLVKSIRERRGDKVNI